MSSTNDTYHHLLVQTQPKSILKKSPSPKFLDSSMNSETTSLHTFSSIDETDKDDIDRNKTINNHVCILNDNQSIKNNNSYLSSIEVPLTTLTMTSNEIDSPMIRILPRADSSSSSSSSSSLTSDDEQQSIRLKLKKNYRRQIVVTDTLSSSNDNDDRKEERSMIESKTTSIRSSKRPQKDMQLDEFMRKYQQYGGIPSPTRKDHDEEQMIIKLPINHHHHHHHYQRPLAKKLTFHVNNELINDDTLSLLEPIDKITLSSNLFSPLQLLFDVARRNQCDDDRRTKINRIRQYVEEQIGISSFLTMYKLIKSSQIFIDIQQKPFCHYANFIPHLCCLIILESEEQKDRLLEK